MRTIELDGTLRRLGARLVTLAELRRLLGGVSENTAYKRAERLARAGVLLRLRKGLYEPASAPASDFQLANALRSPSYVSLQSALNRMGVLSQAPALVTSVTTRPPSRVDARHRTFEFARIRPDLFFGYQRVDGALVALPEKALLDSLYFMVRGLRRLPLEELDLSGIDRSRLRQWARCYRDERVLERVQALWR